MSISVYIASDRIEVIGYKKAGAKVVVEDYARAELAEGVMINGKITDAAELIDRLKELRAKHPKLLGGGGVSLTVDNNSMVTRKIPVPNMNKKQYLNVVKGDLEENNEQYGSLIFDYSFIKKGGPDNYIFACGLEKVILDSYIGVFKEACIKLDRILIGPESVLCYINSRPDLAGKTFVLNIIDGVGMFSLLFSKGNFIMSNRTRLMGERGSEEFLQSVSQSLSFFPRFCSSQNLDSLEASYYLGIDANTAALLSNAVVQGVEIGMFDIRSGTVNFDAIKDNCHFSFLSVFCGKESINLLQSAKKIEKLKGGGRKVNPVPIIGAVLGLAAVGTVLFIQIRVINLEKDVKALNEFLNDPDNTNAVGAFDTWRSEQAAYNRIISEVTAETNVMGRQQQLTNSILDFLRNLDPSHVEVTDFSFNLEARDLSFRAVGSDERVISAYVERLSDHPMFDSVQYTGYAASGTSGYNFSIRITLSEIEPDSDEEIAKGDGQ